MGLSFNTSNVHFEFKEPAFSVMCLTPGVSREEVSRMGGGYRGGRTDGEGTRFMSTTMDWLKPEVH